MKYLAAFICNEFAVDDAVLLQKRKFHQICSILVSKWYKNIHSLQDCFILREDPDSVVFWEADWQIK